MNFYFKYTRLLLPAFFITPLYCANHFVSFVIPTYNRAEKLKRAIDSIYEQKMTIPFEVVCTDDGSRDHTREVLTAYEKKYANFHAYYHEVNMDSHEARNTCLKHAKGDLIFNLDSDNILDLQCPVQKLVELLDATGCEAASFAEIRFFDGDKHQTDSIFYKVDENNISDLRHIMTSGVAPNASGNYLFTKKAFERVGKYYEAAHDTWCFGFRLMATGTQMAILPNSWYWHEAGHGGKYVQDRARGLNEKGIFGVIRKFPEILSQETQNFLFNGAQECAVMQDLAHDTYKLAPQAALNELFKGYKLAEKGLYQEAAQAFALAIKNGCTHPKVHQLLEHALKKTKTAGNNSYTDFRWLVNESL